MGPESVLPLGRPSASIQVAPDNSSHQTTITLHNSTPLENSNPPANSVSPYNSIPPDAPTSPESTTCTIHYHVLKPDGNGFPPYTVGVLYYFQPPDKVFEGGIRFRLMSDVSKFGDSEDLKLPNGDVWQIPLVNLATQAGWKPFLEKLKRENLVEEDVIAGLIRNHRPMIRTLDPRKLQLSGQEVFDLSGILRTAIHVLPDYSTPPDNSVCSIFYHRIIKDDNHRFPPGTVGALYYHLPPPHNVNAGGIRFRLMTDVSQFDSGEDLKLPTGDVWQIPLYRLANWAGWKPLLQKLEDENLVDEGVIAGLTNKCEYVVHTLDPRKMQLSRQGVIDLSGILRTAIHVLPDNSTPLNNSTCSIYYHRILKDDNHRFPPGTVGALYFHPPPPHNPNAGGIRFRLMADVAQFDDGEDLKLPKGTVWQISLFRLATQAVWKPFLEKLKTEDLVGEKAIPDLIINYQPIVHTLDPHKMQLSDQEVFDLSGILHTTVRVLPDDPTPHGNSACSIYYHKFTKIDNQRFPPGTVGALYYHLPPHNAVAGSIRFRLMADVSQFDSGEDLKLPSGSVWHIPLHKLVIASEWEPLLRVVRKESLVDEAVITDLQKLWDKPPLNFNYHYELGQPFVIDLEHATITRGFINRSMAHSFFGTPSKE
ncbi:hypothetical protein CPB84DRAFT_1222498 [Gymnopilus junonius]|uniref:Uncharacterized protein n=1 Tax=Gymnopilus junonius TaxID=109634 RepID=A0A9P5P093_GYMJU|nr:hypothetical protein CPB84DRAFT_1222498 [Gymnopilus junonius]